MSLKKKSNKKSSNQQSLAASGGNSVNNKGSGTSLPEGSRTRLLELFSMIEKEFETLHAENAACKFNVLHDAAIHHVNICYYCLILISDRDTLIVKLIVLLSFPSTK